MSDNEEIKALEEKPIKAKKADIKAPEEKVLDDDGLIALKKDGVTIRRAPDQVPALVKAGWVLV